MMNRDLDMTSIPVSNPAACLRFRERREDLFGNVVTRWRIICISNAYHFHDPKGAGSQSFFF